MSPSLIRPPPTKKLKSSDDGELIADADSTGLMKVKMADALPLPAAILNMFKEQGTITCNL